MASAAAVAINPQRLNAPDQVVAATEAHALPIHQMYPQPLIPAFGIT